MPMSLEDMLALLPDNHEGAIDAADLRVVVTELYQWMETNSARISALEAAGGSTPASISVTGYWQVNPQAGAVPGGGQFTTDTGSLATATWIRFSKYDLSTTDSSTVLTKASKIFFQQKQNAANWARFNVTALASVVGGYVQVPVQFVLGEGAPGSAAWQDAVVVLTIVPQEAT